MSDKTIYIVSACYSYEGSSPVRAFEAPCAAEAFRKYCEDYGRSKPEYPMDINASLNTPKDRKIYGAYYKKLTNWEKNHPAGQDNCYSDAYEISELSLVS